jgi:hypothetical protein
MATTHYRGHDINVTTNSRGHTIAVIRANRMAYGKGTILHRAHGPSALQSCMAWIDHGLREAIPTEATATATATATTPAANTWTPMEDPAATAWQPPADAWLDDDYQLQRDTHLSILKLPPNFTPPQLRAALKDVIGLAHPDHGGNAATFEQLHRAYKFLEADLSIRQRKSAAD